MYIYFSNSDKLIFESNVLNSDKHFACFSCFVVLSLFRALSNIEETAFFVRVVNEFNR